MKTPLIEFKDVTKCFGDKIVLDRVNLQIYEGEVTTIIGLSGSGKSVLLKHIIGLLQPDEGVILFRGKPVSEMSRSDLAGSFGQISYMFQGNALFDSMTVYDNIALPLIETTRLKKTEIHRKVLVRMKQTELTEAAYKYPSELSGGMQKRAALARPDHGSEDRFVRRADHRAGSRSEKRHFEHDRPESEKAEFHRGSGQP